VISGFRRDVDENCPLRGYFTDRLSRNVGQKLLLLTSW